MKVSSLTGAATARTAMLQTPTPSAATTPGAGPPVTRPVAMPPPPRASSFGGADPRAMFEALVQSFDSDGNGTLSLNEVNALNQGGLLARSFGRIDTNADGAISGDEIAAVAPWGGTPGDQGDRRGTNLEPPLDPSSSATARDVAAVSQADSLPGFSRNLGNLPADPASLMEMVVLALGADLYLAARRGGPKRG
ncbi:MAG: hypothetical protein H7245_18830 [Candidatus Saccharibacteria bacterium]|nr:hypothetical protein [Pseudorhodobacter sp.]